MSRVNLRDYYSFYKEDCFIDVPDEVYAEIRKSERREAAYNLRTYRNKAYYSLDYGDDIERFILFAVMSPQDILQSKLMKERLYSAIAGLSEKQAKRTYAHFFLGMSKADIARTEGVNEGNIRKSINQALRKIKKSLKDFEKGGTVLPKK